MERREFIKYAAIAPAVAAFRPNLGHGLTFPTQTYLDKLDRDVDRMIATVGDKGKFAGFEGWNVLWTGWKGCSNSIDIAHQWVMSPVKPFGAFARPDDPDRPACVVYISMPG